MKPKCTDCLEKKNSTRMSQHQSSVEVQPRYAAVPAVDPSAAIVYKNEGNGHVQISGNSNGYQHTFSRLPHRTPVDMQFENIEYTVSMGFNISLPFKRGKTI